MRSIAPRPETVAPLIHVLRGERVLLSQDLAALYPVPVKVLNQAARRNVARFPEDFMFRLTRAEADAALRSGSRSVTLKRGQNIKYMPYAFTDVATLLRDFLQDVKECEAGNWWRR